MKKLTLLLAVVASATLFSCKSTEKGKLISTEQFQSLNESAENNGKRFCVAGHFYIDGDIQVSTFDGLSNQSQYPQIWLYEEPNGQGKMIGAFPIQHGKGKNEFDTPDNFTIDDVTFYDNDGNPLKHTDKMEVSFTMELQTERDRHESNGKMVYYGSPIDVRIDKAK